MNALSAFYIFCIGACLGSFMNVMIYRMPRGLSIVTPPSSCTSCGVRIRQFDNIPLISWFLLKGRCRNCGEKISPIYPVVELITAMLFLAVFLRFGLTWEGYLGFAVVFFGLAAAFSDLMTAMDDSFECGIIPDGIVFTGLVVGGFLSFLANGSALFPIYGAAAGFLGLFIPSYLFKIIRKKEGMGGGDIKLMAMFGAMLGVKSLFVIIFGSAFLGAFIGIGYQIIFKKKNMMMPFGPFIALASVIYLFYGKMLNALLLGI